MFYIKSTKKKALLVIVLLMAITGGSIGYYLWNKGARDVKNATGIIVTSTELYKTFTTDSSAASKKYTGKIVSVTGQVLSVTPNQQHQTVVLLKTMDEGAYINCTFEGPLMTAKAGETITVKGICDGYNAGDPEMGLPGDVVITRCYEVSENNK